MDQAKYKGKVIRLSELAREKYEAVYESALRGQVACIACGEPVKLYLGMQKQPHFYHEHRLACPLSGESKLLDEWNMPVAYQPSSPFQRKKPKIVHLETGYIRALSETGIPLDAAQLQAVRTTEGPLLVLAGAGSGKTRVLTARTAYMIAEKNIPPSSIMLVTFTTKAAKEMKDRLLTYLGMHPSFVSQLVTGTFHSIFYRMISHFDRERWHISRLLKWEWQREQMIKEAGRELDLDERQFAYDQALQQISYWKNTLVTVQNVKANSQWEKPLALHICFKFTV